VRTWTDNLPQGWRVAHPKTLFRERREPSQRDDVHLTPSQHHGVLPQAEYMKRTGSKVVLNLAAPDNMKHVEPNDFVAHLRSFQGGIEKSSMRGKVSTAYTVISPLPEADPGFYRWALKSGAFISELAANCEQLRDGQSVKFGDFVRIRLPHPPLDEQRRIADFLDDRVACIDQIITARRQQSAAVGRMSHAALSALLDEVGSRYGLAPLRRFCGGIEQGSSPVSDDRPAGPGEPGVIKTSAIQMGVFRAEQNKVMPADCVDPRYLIRSGDLLVTRGSGSAELVGDAAVAVVPSDLMLYLSDLTYRIRLLELDPVFTSLSIISARGRAELGARVRQGSGPAKARGEDILSIPVPAAPSADQMAIARRASSDRTTMEKRRQQLDLSIARLSEYKQSLITAAVSGELDVSTVGSGIPG